MQTVIRGGLCFAALLTLVAYCLPWYVGTLTDETRWVNEPARNKRTVTTNEMSGIRRAFGLPASKFGSGHYEDGAAGPASPLLIAAPILAVLAAALSFAPRSWLVFGCLLLSGGALAAFMSGGGSGPFPGTPGGGSAVQRSQQVFPGIVVADFKTEYKVRSSSWVAFAALCGGVVVSSLVWLAGLAHLVSGPLGRPRELDPSAVGEGLSAYDLQQLLRAAAEAERTGDLRQAIAKYTAVAECAGGSHPNAALARERVQELRTRLGERDAEPGAEADRGGM